MYAPKFRSWMTRWERFDEMLEFMLAEYEAAAKVETKKLVALAMADIDKRLPVPTPSLDNLMWAAQNSFWNLGLTNSALGNALAYGQQQQRTTYYGDWMR